MIRVFMEILFIPSLNRFKGKAYTLHRIGAKLLMGDFGSKTWAKRFVTLNIVTLPTSL